MTLKSRKSENAITIISDNEQNLCIFYLKQSKDQLFLNQLTTIVSFKMFASLQFNFQEIRFDILPVCEYQTFRQVQHTCHTSHCEIKSHRIWPFCELIPIRFSNLTEFSDHLKTHFIKK